MSLVGAPFSVPLIICYSNTLYTFSLTPILGVYYNTKSGSFKKDPHACPSSTALEWRLPALCVYMSGWNMPFKDPSRPMNRILGSTQTHTHTQTLSHLLLNNKGETCEVEEARIAAQRQHKRVISYRLSNIALTVTTTTTTTKRVVASRILWIYIIGIRMCVEMLYCCYESGNVCMICA